MRRAVAWRGSLATACALLGWLALSSCRELDGPETQVMLRIHTDDRQLVAAMTSLQVSFALDDDAPAGWRSYVTREFAKGVLRWPVDVPIVPSEPADEAKRFEVVIEALDGSRVLAQQRAVTGFVAGGLRLLEVWLYTCPGQDALHCVEPGCQHDGCGVCMLDGACGSSVIARERLPAFEVDEDPVSRPPLDATGVPGGAIAPGGSSAGTGAQSGTGADAGIANPSGAPTLMPGMPGGTGSIGAGAMPAGADAGATMGMGGSTGASGMTGASEPDSGARDAGGALIGGGMLDAGPRDGGSEAGSLDSGADAAADTGPREASIPEGGTIGGFTGGQAGGSSGGLFGGGPGGTATLSDFASADESEFGPGSYSGE